MQNNYQSSVRWYEKAYEAAREAHDLRRATGLKCKIGHVKAKSLSPQFNHLVLANTPESVGKLLQWANGPDAASL